MSHEALISLRTVEKTRQNDIALLIGKLMPEGKVVDSLVQEPKTEWMGSIKASAIQVRIAKLDKSGQTSSQRLF